MWIIVYGNHRYSGEYQRKHCRQHTGGDKGNKLIGSQDSGGALRQHTGFKCVSYRRIDTIKDHIKHSENFKKYRKVKVRYEELYSVHLTAKKATGFGAERKAQKALETANEYYEDNRPQIAMFDNAEKYLRDVLQGR